MVSLYEIFILSFMNYGEKTPRSTFDVSGTKDLSIMKDSNILSRDEGIVTYNSENTKSDIGPSINESIIKSLKKIQ